MKTFFDCIPCFVLQSLDAARLVTEDEAVHERVLRGVLRLASEMDLNESPPAMGQQIHRLIREATRDSDPYSKLKEHSNRFALELLPWMRQKISEAAKPFEMAVRLAVAGNILDFGVNPHLQQESARTAIEQTLSQPINLDAVDQLESDIQRADSILYIGDNAGEIAFDRVLIEQMPRQNVTFAVRGNPVINDATMADAVTCGLTEVVEVIDNGSDAPGTILLDCSPEFRERFRQAALVISKGQGNYETMSDQQRLIWFLLKAKCPVIARDIGCAVGTVALIRHGGTSESGPRMRGSSCQEIEVGSGEGNAR